MSNHFNKTTLIFTVFFCLAAFVFICNRAFAGTDEHWVSVDAAELDVVAASAKVFNDRPLNADVARVIEGVAILQLDDSQMEDLSRGMHENFHKCGGFVFHASEAEAVAWVERMRSAERETPAVTYTIDNQAVVNTLMAAARESDNRQVILDLSAFPNRRYNQASGLESANWIRNKWTQLAGIRRDISVEFFNHPSNVSPQPSVIMTIRGSSLPNEIVVLGAHQDSINGGGSTLTAPGAR